MCQFLSQGKKTSQYWLVALEFILNNRKFFFFLICFSVQFMICNVNWQCIMILQIVINIYHNYILESKLSIKGLFSWRSEKLGE